MLMADASNMTTDRRSNDSVDKPLHYRDSSSGERKARRIYKDNFVDYVRDYNQGDNMQKRASSITISSSRRQPPSLSNLESGQALFARQKRHSLMRIV